MNVAYENASPRAGAMVESMRAFGYTPETAIADLIDNSIAAGARNVWIKFWWAGKDSYVSVSDDGRGMSEHELFEAMRLGTVGPLETRDPTDLGRFGLGLKTASFSQCRRLTVATRDEHGAQSTRCWDLDYVQQTNEWRLLKAPATGSESLLESPSHSTSGTVVLWEGLDRIIVAGSQPSDRRAQDHFLRIVRAVEDHLGMVFHRMLQGPLPRLRIWIDGGAMDGPKAIDPWDPFLETHPATTHFPEERIHVAGGSIVVKGFVLPHKSHLRPGEHDSVGGPGGWNARQGFYVYRNERLVVPGSWLGIGADRQWTREEHYKLARIRVDFPNSMDLQWQLDVKKSDARPPAEIRERLRELALVVRTKAREVYAFRGGLGAGTKRSSAEPESPWKATAVSGHPVYRLKREYPLIRQLKSCTRQEDQSALEGLLRVIEETVPIHRVWIDMAEHPDAHSAPFEFDSTEDLQTLAHVYHRALVENVGLSHEEALDRISRMDPFARAANTPELLQELAD